MLPSAWIVALGLACGPSEPAAPPPPPPPSSVNLLGEAPTEPWVQELWFEAEPGERIEQVFVERSVDPLPIVSLVAQDGTRRAVRLEGPGLAVTAQVTVRPDARERTTDTLESAGLRAVVQRDDTGLVVEVTDTRGGGRHVLLRDPGSIRLRHPAIAGSGAAVYVDAAPPLGGVWRLPYPEGPLVRIVPEVSGAAPVDWSTPDAERIVYVEDSDPARVLVAYPLDGLPLRPVAEVRREGRLPRTLLPVLPTADGPMIPEPCEPLPELVLSPVDGGVEVGDVLATEARYCGRRCTELFGTSAEGAPRHLARLEQGDVVWTAAFGLDTGIVGQHFVQPAVAADLTKIPACFEKPAPGSWLVSPRLSSAPGYHYTHLEHSGDLVIIHGSGPKGPHVVTMSAHKGVFATDGDRGRAAPPPIAKSPDGTAEARVEDGALVWVETATGAKQVVLPGDDGAEYADPAFSIDGQELWVVDHGAEPGLLQIDLAGGFAARRVPWKGLARPKPANWDGFRQVLWLRQVGDIAWMGSARPMTELEAHAFALGPVTLTEVTPSWTPVALHDGGFVRCEADDTVRLGVDAEGGFLTWGAQRFSARAAAFDGKRLRVFDLVDGAATELAVLTLEPQGARWSARHVGRSADARAWLPTEQAQDLPMGGPCRTR